MTEPLKPVSDLARRLLAKLGESPADHQKQIQDLRNKVYVKSNSTTKLPNVHKLNSQVEGALTISEPSASIAARLEASRAEEEWIPEAYVLFIRRSRCLSCRDSRTCLDLPHLFLRHRRSKRFKASDVQGLPSLYLPIKGFAHGPLPRHKEVRFTTLKTCEFCFLGAQECKDLPPPSPSPQEDTKSSGFEATKPDVHHVDEYSYSQRQYPEWKSYESLAAFVGSAYPTTFTSGLDGCSSESCEREKDVDARDIHSLTKSSEAARTQI